MKTKVLNNSCHIEIKTLEWFDKVYGNTYQSFVVYLYDEKANIYERHYLPIRYGYGDARSNIDAILKECGYRLRNMEHAQRCKRLRSVSFFKKDVLKRHMIKEYEKKNYFSDNE